MCGGTGKHPPIRALGKKEDDAITVRRERADTRELALFEGWNLIGLPLTPEDPSIEVVLADILSEVISARSFDGETKTWSYYSPGTPSDLTELVEGKGYWINMTKDATLTVTRAHEQVKRGISRN